MDRRTSVFEAKSVRAHASILLRYLSGGAQSTFSWCTLISLLDLNIVVIASFLAIKYEEMFNKMAHGLCRSVLWNKDIRPYLEDLVENKILNVSGDYFILFCC